MATSSNHFRNTIQRTSVGLLLLISFSVITLKIRVCFLGRETNDEASQQQTADDNLDGDQDLASTAIIFLPHFAFYTKNHIVEPFDVSQEAFEQRLIEPTTFWEAYNHPDPKQHAKWQTAIKKEFHNMNQHGVWHKVRCSSILKG